MNEPGREPAPAPVERILGVDFFTGTLDDACRRGRDGAFVVAPSGPGLACDLREEPAYRAALHAADVVLTDSGFLLMLWRWKTGRRLPRHSGLACLRHFLAVRPRRHVFWVMPGEAEARCNAAWLEAAGWPVDPADCYLAPHYGAGAIDDAALQARIEARRPEVIMLAIGGGVQERLGHGLRQRLSYRPGIFCLGAAIAFLSGMQVGIPVWVDRARLGWLWRTCSKPRLYGLRYLRALPLARLVWRHGAGDPAGR